MTPKSFHTEALDLLEAHLHPRHDPSIHALGLVIGLISDRFADLEARLPVARGLQKRCTFCQSPVEADTHAQVLEHVTKCPRHPMRAVEAELAALKHRLATSVVVVPIKDLQVDPVPGSIGTRGLIEKKKPWRKPEITSTTAFDRGVALAGQVDESIRTAVLERITAAEAHPDDPRPLLEVEHKPDCVEVRGHSYDEEPGCDCGAEASRYYAHRDAVAKPCRGCNHTAHRGGCGALIGDQHCACLGCLDCASPTHAAKDCPEIPF